MSKEETTPKLLPNPLTKTLSSATRLTGYVGSSNRDGVHCLHAALDRLGQYCEIADSDILHSTVLDPKDGHTEVWVRADATVSFLERDTGTASTFSQLAKSGRIARRRLQVNSETVRSLGSSDRLPTPWGPYISGPRACTTMEDFHCHGPETREFVCTYSIPC